MGGPNLTCSRCRNVLLICRYADCTVAYRVFLKACLMPTYPFQTTDFLGRALTLSAAPQRIVSLVPSQTELLFDLGLEDYVVGITSFCVHPPVARQQKTVIGGTKNPKIERIRALKPDLVIANKEENVAEHIHAIAEFAPVWVSEVANLADNQRMITEVGALTNREAAANRINNAIAEAFDNLPKIREPSRALYLIWRKPYMAAGGDTFINAMLEEAGFQNVLDRQHRYPECTLEQMRTLQPEVVLLSSEPYPFRERHIKELQQELPDATILLVNGELFSWYGSRMQKAPAYFCRLQEQLKLR